MSSLDDYRARVTGTIKSNVSDDSKKLYQISFKNSPSYYPVTVNTASSPYISTPLDAQIVDDPTKTKEVKQIQLIPNQTLNYGDLISWLGDYWLTTTVDYMGGMYYRGSMQKCYSSLKWQDSTLTTREAFFTFTTSTEKGLGIVDGKVMILPNERRYISVQNNIYTSQIVKGQRFIFDEGRCWRVVSINSLLTGLINLELEEQELNTTLDNVSLRICNYVVPTTIFAGLLYITSPTNPLNQIKVNLSKTYQGVVNASPVPVFWEIHDVSKTGTTNLASIFSFTSTSCVLKANNSNLYGSVQLKATLQSDASQYYWQQINVTSLV